MFRFPRCCLEPFSFSQSNLRPQPIFPFSSTCLPKEDLEDDTVAVPQALSLTDLKGKRRGSGATKSDFLEFLEVPQVDTISNLGSNHLVLKSLEGERITCCVLLKRI